MYANLFRLIHGFIDEHRDADLRIEAIGRKGRDYFRRRDFNLSGEHIGIVEKPKYEQAAEIAGKMIEQYSKAELDALLGALPLHEWMRTSVTPLDQHPNDPARIRAMPK